MTTAPTLTPAAGPARRQRARLAGRVDSHTIDQVVATIDQAAAGGGDVVIDLSEVRFLDLHALRAITACATRVAARGDRLVIGAMSTAAAVILELVGSAGLAELPATAMAVAA